MDLDKPQMTEVVIFPEMEVAGTEALVESQRQGLDDTRCAIEVYLAMRAVYLIAVIPNGESVH